MAVHRAHTVNGFLNWLVTRKYLDANPFAELRHRYGGSTADIVRGLASPNPEEALAALRPSPPFSSHLGCVMRDHISRMRTLGMRYGHDYAFRLFLCRRQRKRGPFWRLEGGQRLGCAVGSPKQAQWGEKRP
jgi:hypothetical protein